MSVGPRCGGDDHNIFRKDAELIRHVQLEEEGVGRPILVQISLENTNPPELCSNICVLTTILLFFTFLQQALTVPSALPPLLLRALEESPRLLEPLLMFR